MTQKMEKYFGFKVFVTEDLRPEDEAILRSKAKEIVDVEGIDLNNYHVYLHQMVIRANDEHFGISGGLSKRLQKINIEFYVNEKQRANGDIRFMNHVIHTSVPQEIKPVFTPEWIGYEIPISYFESKNWFQNAIIAFVKKDMHRDRRKIKVVVSASPSETYIKILRRDKSDVSTNLDLRFTKHVQLSLPFSYDQARPMDRKVAISMTYNNYGNAGAFGNNPVARDFTNNQDLISAVKSLRGTALAEGNAEVVRDIDKFIECTNQKTNLKAMEYLKNFGVWALDKTEKLGMVAATEAIKHAISSS